MRAYVSLDGRIRSFTEVFKSDDDPPERRSGEVRYLNGGLVELWIKWAGDREAGRTFRGKPPSENPFLR
jgi:hypothetical protein